VNDTATASAATIVQSAPSSAAAPRASASRSATVIAPKSAAETQASRTASTTREAIPAPTGSALRSATVRALVKAKAEPGLWLEDVPVPEIGINDALIRVRKTGICGTDLHISDWDEWAQSTIPVPMVVGHEFVGQVVEVGANVSDFQPGDLVSGEGHVVCGRCRNCMAGRRHLCAHSIGLGVQRPGAFAEYVALPMTNLWHHWIDVDEDVASIFDPFGNAVHTALTFPVLGEDVLITGAGPIGCMATAVVRHAGARHIAVTDLNPYRLELARKMGATLAVDPRERDLKDVQAELGMTEGFDIGLEMSGSPDALHAMVASMAHGGRIALLGLPPDRVEVDLSTVIFNMLTLKGIYGREMYESWYQMTVLLQSGLDIRPVITHRFSHRDFEEAFAVAHSGQSGKVILDWMDT
jgi:threonine 3-dehydrogenase